MTWASVSIRRPFSPGSAEPTGSQSSAHHELVSAWWCYLFATHSRARTPRASARIGANRRRSSSRRDPLKGFCQRTAQLGATAALTDACLRACRGAKCTACAARWRDRRRAAARAVSRTAPRVQRETLLCTVFRVSRAARVPSCRSRQFMRALRASSRRAGGVFPKWAPLPAHFASAAQPQALRASPWRLRCAAAWLRRARCSATSRPAQWAP